MRVYRITKQKFLTTAWAGQGARSYGGRWNSIGHRAVYTASSISLAMLEMLVHLNRVALLKSYVLLEVEVPGEEISRLETLPDNWRQEPAPRETRQVGDVWLKGRSSPALAVPSVIVPQEYNVILNPEHPHFDAIVATAKTQPIEFDQRLK